MDLLRFYYTQNPTPMEDEDLFDAYFITRYNANQRRIVAGIEIKPKGRPRKDGTELPPSVQQLSKVVQLLYEMSRKDAKIKALEMENELMRDFLSLTERK